MGLISSLSRLFSSSRPEQRPPPVVTPPANVVAANTKALVAKLDGEQLQKLFPKTFQAAEARGVYSERQQSQFRELADQLATDFPDVKDYATLVKLAAQLDADTASLVPAKPSVPVTPLPPVERTVPTYRIIGKDSIRSLEQLFPKTLEAAEARGEVASGRAGLLLDTANLIIAKHPMVKSYDELVSLVRAWETENFPAAPVATESLIGSTQGETIYKLFPKTTAAAEARGLESSSVASDVRSLARELMAEHPTVTNFVELSRLAFQLERAKFS